MIHPDDGSLELKQSNWPSVDCATWSTLFAEGDILDGQGPLAHWRLVTRQKCAQSYGYWLAYLIRTGQLNGDTDPAKRATPDVITAYIDATLSRCTIETTHMRLAELKKIVIAMSPETNWDWLKKVEERLRRRCRHGQLKQRAVVTARELYDWGLNRMAKAEADKNLSTRDCAVHYRQGLVVALLIARPIRQRAFLSLQIGKSVVENRGTFVLALDADDTKDGKAREYPLPDGLNAAMGRYISHHRQVLLADTQSDALWITKDGCEFTRSGFSVCLAKLTRREFGETFRSHAFWSCHGLMPLL